MYPILFTIGTFKFATVNLFYILAFLATGFILWRRAREENYDEMLVFDGFLSACLWGILLARIGFIALNFQQFGFNVLHFFDLINHPGFEIQFFVVVLLIAFYRFAIKQKLDQFAVLDFLVTALSLGAVFLHLGYFLAGIKIGTPTNLPWGIVPVGVFEKHHPVQLYFALVYLILFIVLSRLEYVYRTFEWYRAKKNSAQSGFLTSVFLIFSGLLLLPLTFFKVPTFSLGILPLDWISFLLSFVFGLGLLMNRAGRTVFPQKKRKTWINQDK